MATTALSSPADTLRSAIRILSHLLETSTPGRPRWFVEPNDLLGCFCVMPRDATPSLEEGLEVADFPMIDDARLIVVMQAAAGPLLTMMRGVLKTHLELTSQLLPGDGDAWEIPADIVALARAIVETDATAPVSHE